MQIILPLSQIARTSSWFRPWIGKVTSTRRCLRHIQEWAIGSRLMCLTLSKKTSETMCTKCFCKKSSETVPRWAHRASHLTSWQTTRALTSPWLSKKWKRGRSAKTLFARCNSTQLKTLRCLLPRRRPDLLNSPRRNRVRGCLATRIKEQVAVTSTYLWMSSNRFKTI